MVVASGCRRAEGPVQPIAFSHRLHAGDLQIACLYCHTTATRSTSAGAPPVETCYGCHRLVKLQNPQIKSAQVQSPEIKKMLDSWDAKKPIAWVRIHTLPDFVYFSHKRHVLKGIACQECHGEIQRMERVSQVSPLTMGWCLDCHEQRGGPRDCDVCHK
jgi:hypothetical protein